MTWVVVGFCDKVETSPTGPCRPVGPDGPGWPATRRERAIREVVWKVGVVLSV